MAATLEVACMEYGIWAGQLEVEEEPVALAFGQVVVQAMQWAGLKQELELQYVPPNKDMYILHKNKLKGAGP